MNNNINSLLFTSYILSSKNLLKEPPKDILLNMYIVYAAENTTEEQAKTPNTGNLSTIL